MIDLLVVLVRWEPAIHQKRWNLKQLSVFPAQQYLGTVIHFVALACEVMLALYKTRNSGHLCFSLLSQLRLNVI